MLSSRLRYVLFLVPGFCGGLLSLGVIDLEGASAAKPAKATATKPPPAPAQPPPAIGLRYVAASSKRVLRLFPNASANIEGSDRGVPIEHDGKIWFLFGDTIGRQKAGVPAASMPITDPMRVTPPRVVDSAGATLKLGYVRDGHELLLSAFEVAVGGLSLPVRTVKPLAPEPKHWLDSGMTSDIPTDAAPQVPQVPQTGYAVFKVCEDRARCAAYSDEDSQGKDPPRESILVRFDPQGLRNVYLRTLSRESEWSGSGTGGGKFLNVSMVHFTGDVPNVKVPGPYVFLFGTGKYRASNPYLALVPEQSLATGQDTLYFAGIDPKKGVMWSKQEADAEPILDDKQPGDKGPGMGDLSAAFVPEFGKWLLAYDVKTTRKIAKPIAVHIRPLTDEREICSKEKDLKPVELPTREVVLRTSNLPWTGWSQRQVLFNPVTDKAFGEFIYDAHQNTERNYMLTPRNMPALPEGQSTCRSGSVYAPFLVPQLFKWVVDAQKRERFVITWTLSTYKPYHVYLMQSELEMQRPPGASRPPAVASAPAAPNAPATPAASAAPAAPMGGAPAKKTP